MNYSSIGDSTVLSGAVSGGTSESIEYSGYITQGALLNIEFSQVTDASSQIVLGTEETKDEIISNLYKQIAEMKIRERKANHNWVVYQLKNSVMTYKLNFFITACKKLKHFITYSNDYILEIYDKYNITPPPKRCLPIRTGCAAATTSYINASEYSQTHRTKRCAEICLMVNITL